MGGLVAKGNNEQQKKRMMKGLKTVVRWYEVKRNEFKCGCGFKAKYQLIRCPMCGNLCSN